MLREKTELVIFADEETTNRYLHPFEMLNINLKKENKIMVDLEKIKAEIQALRELNADEYLAEDIAKLKADFEASREQKIHEFERALEIYEQYQIVEEQEDEVVENVAEAY